ncbi:site-specific integrase [Azonexus hydrophilus]|uniref:site-specific integrase n=1 Tax=Azonexus hydrophilus TaxID=418702 RepID=UPI0004280921|nr:site-specific integrase [Azonexus hydrophilus]
MPGPFTYTSLIEEQTRRVQLENLNEQTAANRATALRGFLKANHLGIDDVIGDEMRMKYPEALETYLNDLVAQGRSNKSITNTRSAMARWRESVVEYDTQQALSTGENTPFCQALQSLLEGKAIKTVAREAGVPPDMLRGWCLGKIPRSSSTRYIIRLESHFGLERNTLLSLTGAKATEGKAQLGGPPRKNEYNEKVALLAKTPYLVKPEEDSLLRLQWREYLVYKTAAVPKLKRTKKGKWRFSPCPLSPPTEANWFEFLDGKEIASARMNWSRTAGYLGYLSTPLENNGIGLPVAVAMNFAWLAIPDYLESYLDWMHSRMGKRNRSVNHFLALIASLVRPRFGYLRQKPELQKTLPEEFHSEPWESICDRQLELTECLVTAYASEIEASRDSFAPIREIVEMEQPLYAIADMIQRMKGDRPIGQPRRESIWARDILLVKLLVSNPLRRRNLAHLTWRADNSGDLYQRVDKSWWVRIAKNKFKNRMGAAGDNIYDCQVHPSAWLDIERYIFKYRPTLLRSPTDLVFLTKSSHGVSHRPWTGLSARVQELTSKYLPRSSGIGAHAFRHIVATAILKADGGDYKTAALVLNDRIQTVERNYSGVRSSDGASRMARLLEGPFSKM